MSLQKEETQKLAVHACAHDRRQESNVLIVSVLALILLDLALRSEVQERIEVQGVCEFAIVFGLGATPLAVVGDAKIEDEVPRLGRVLEVVDELDVAALLPFAVD